MDELLTVQEVAYRLRVSRTTVWRWCSEGKLKAFKIGRNWRIRQSSVNNLLEGVENLQGAGEMESTHR